MVDNFEQFNDYKKWLKEKIVRSSSICQVLNDDIALTEEQILQKLKAFDAIKIQHLNQNIQKYSQEIEKLQKEYDNLNETIVLNEYDKLVKEYDKAITNAKELNNSFEAKRQKFEIILNAIQSSDNKLVQALFSTVQDQFNLYSKQIENTLKYAEYKKPPVSKQKYFEYYKTKIQKQINNYERLLENSEFDLAEYTPLANQYIKYCNAIDELEV